MVDGTRSKESVSWGKCEMAGGLTSHDEEGELDEDGRKRATCKIVYFTMFDMRIS